MRFVFIRLLLLFIYIVLVFNKVDSQTFPCDGSLYLTQHDRRPPTILNKIKIENNATIFEKAAEYSVELNAIGLNPKDNYIYGFEKGTLAIHQLRSDGTHVQIGNAQGYEGNNCASGAFTKNGIYIIQDRRTEKLHFYQINPSFSKVNDVLLNWAPSSGNSGICDVNFDDIIVDPDNDNRLITYQRNYRSGNAPSRTEGHILAVDIDFNSNTFGEVSVIGYVSEDIILQIGAMFFGNDGVLYGYGAKDQNFTQKHLVGLNIQNTSGSSYIAQGPVSENTDGCSCPVDIKLEKSIVNIDQYCDSLIVEYQFKLKNNSDQQFSNLSFSDALPLDGKFSESLTSGPIWNSNSVTLSQDFNELSITEIIVQPLDSLTFTAHVQYATTTKVISNQAVLSGFNSLVGDEIYSDDPSTDEPSDPTSFQVDKLFSISNDTIIKNICFGESVSFHEKQISKTGTYTDSLISKNGCDSIVTLNLTVSKELKVDATTNYMVDHCSVLQADLTPSFDVDSIAWEPPSGLSCNDCLRPEIYVDGDRTYLVRLYDRLGCSVELPISINSNGSENGRSVYIPNIFTPLNNDDINDHFTLFSNECIALIEEMKIYDRWGNLVFDQHDFPPNLPDLGWDGSFNSKRVNPGVYVYHFKVRNFDGSHSEYYGDVTVH
jgi:gliding motility-associated-like protein